MPICAVPRCNWKGFFSACNLTRRGIMQCKTVLFFLAPHKQIMDFQTGFYRSCRFFFLLFNFTIKPRRWIHMPLIKEGNYTLTFSLKSAAQHISQMQDGVRRAAATKGLSASKSDVQMIVSVNLTCSILQTLWEGQWVAPVLLLSYRIYKERFSMSAEKYPKVKDIMLKHDLLKAKVTCMKSNWGKVFMYLILNALNVNYTYIYMYSVYHDVQIWYSEFSGKYNLFICKVTRNLSEVQHL